MPKEKTRSNASVTKITGKFLIVVSLVLLFLNFYPLITAEIDYLFSSPLSTPTDIVMDQKPQINKSKKIIPVDKEFGLIIPKINVNTSVVHNVDSQNPQEYQSALAKGVAHAKTSAFPDEIGNTFIFSHSSVDFLKAKMFNSILYLLNKLVIDDEFYVTYENDLYKYRINDIKKVSKDEIKYLEGVSSNRQVTLMTCWPPGTDIKRLIVVGELESIN